MPINFDGGMTKPFFTRCAGNGQLTFQENILCLCWNTCP